MTRRPGRLSPSAGGGAYSPGGRAGQLDQQAEDFRVHVTGTTSYDTGSGTITAYTGFEVWVQPDGTTAQVQNGRVLTASQPGVFLDAYDPGAVSADAPVLALARLAPGAGGRYWELFPSGVRAGSGSGASSGSSCTLETVRFDVVTDVTCDPVLGLVATRERISVTGCNLSISAGDVPSGAGGGGVVAGTCTGAGQSLASHPALLLTVPDGSLAGSYTLAWRAGTNDGWQGTAGGQPVYVWVNYTDGQQHLAYLGVDSAPAAIACDPYAASWPGSVMGASGAVTAAVAP